MIEKLTELRAQEKQYRDELLHYYQTHQVHPAEAFLRQKTAAPDAIWATLTSPKDEVKNAWFI